MVWEASEWDFIKTEGFTFGFLKFTTDADGNQNKCEEVCESQCEPWNAIFTAKLKEVMQAGRDAFAWQKREDFAKQKGANFDRGSNRDKLL